MSLAKTQGALALLDEPIYQGTSSNPDVPQTFDVAIAGRTFMIDRDFNSYGTRFKDQSIELLRPQADTSQEPSESGINPDATWIRSQHSWHHGAGQALFDKAASDTATPSDRERFRSSKGVDVWTEGQLGLLPIANPTGSRPTQFITAYRNMLLYVEDDSAANGPGAWRVAVADDVGATLATHQFTNLTLTTTALYGLATDGSNVWIAAGPDGLIALTDPIGSASSNSVYITDPVAGPVGYVKARLMVADQNSIYNVTASGTLPTALFSQANTDFAWVGFAEGTDQIYAAGWSGHKSLIYRIQVTSDGTTLDQPIVAGQLPDGEIISSIFGYLGFVFLGTNKGVRYCVPDAQGNLTIGDVIPTSSPVRCFTATGRWVYFGLTNYDTISTGIGRMDLRTLANEGAQQLAWASDMLAAAQGNVTSIAIFDGYPYFTIARSDGSTASVATPSDLSTTSPVNLVTSAQLTTGTLDYGMVPDKVTTSLDARFGPSFTGTVSAEIAGDGADWQMIGYESTAGTLKQNWETRQVRGSHFELRFTLTRGSSTAGPNLTGWTLNAEPTGSFREVYLWPLRLDHHNQPTGGEQYHDVQDNLDFIKNLHQTRTVFTAQRSSTSYRCVLTDYQFWPDSRNDDGTWNGTMLTWLKRVAA